MNPYAGNMNQVATYWPPTANDGFGGMTYGDPVVIKCRWQDRAELFRATDGQEITSSAVVYTDRPLQVQGKIVEGESESANPTAQAREIRQKARSPNLSGTVELNKIWL